MFNVLMYDKETKRICGEYDIDSKEVVINDYLKPYLNKEAFFIDGVKLNQDRVDKIVISEATSRIDGLVNAFKIKHRGSGVVLFAKRENVAQNESFVSIVTKQLLEEAKEILKIASSNNDCIKSNKVFVVYGHDEITQLKVTDFVQKLGLSPVILADKPNLGMTIIEKLEENSDVGFAIVLYTSDDFVQSGAETYKQPRPNVIFEYGYFMGKLGRKNIALLVNEEIKSHSDILGTGYIKLSNDDGWKLQLAKELRAAGYNIDMNKIVEF